MRWKEFEGGFGLGESYECSHCHEMISQSESDDDECLLFTPWFDEDEWDELEMTFACDPSMILLCNQCCGGNPQEWWNKHGIDLSDAITFEDACARFVKRLQGWANGAGITSGLPTPALSQSKRFGNGWVLCDRDGKVVGIVSGDGQAQVSDHSCAVDDDTQAIVSARYYTTEHINYEADLHVTHGNDNLRHVLTQVLVRVPAAVIDAAFNGCLYLMPEPEEQGCFIPKTITADKDIILLPHALLDRPFEEQVKTVLHETAHFHLGHRSPLKDVELDYDQQEKEANDLVVKWLRQWESRLADGHLENVDGPVERGDDKC